MTDAQIDLLAALHGGRLDGHWTHDGHRIYAPNGREVALVHHSRDIVSIVAARNFMPAVLAELRVRRAEMSGLN